jgi:hypothetical protein
MDTSLIGKSVLDIVFFFLKSTSPAVLGSSAERGRGAKDGGKRFVE